MRNKSIIAFVALLIIIASLLACSKESERADGTRNSAKQVYQKVDPAELDFVLETYWDILEMDADGSILRGVGRVHTLAVGDTKIDLDSRSLRVDGPDAFINTKEFGDIKVTFNNRRYSKTPVTFWVTATQKKALLKLKK